MSHGTILMGPSREELDILLDAQESHKMPDSILAFRVKFSDDAGQRHSIGTILPIAIGALWRLEEEQHGIYGTTQGAMRRWVNIIYRAQFGIGQIHFGSFFEQPSLLVPDWIEARFRAVEGYLIRNNRIRKYTPRT